MTWQAVLLVLTAALYVIGHYHIPARETFPKPHELVQIDSFGRASVVSAEDLDWYVGSTKAVPLLAIMNTRNRDIETRIGTVRQLLADTTDSISDAAVTTLRELIEKGCFPPAAEELARLHQRLSPGTLAEGGDRLLNRLEDKLRELAELREAQENTLARLTPPKKVTIFWASPWGIAAEVVGWSLFGLFASLLFHSAQAVSEARFDESETVVGWAKMFYTPIVAIVVVMAVVLGIMNVESVETRVWMIPLFGVLCGWNCRKAAMLVDVLSEWALGRLTQSLQRQGKQPVGTGSAAILNALQPPRSYDEVAAKAKDISAAMLAREIQDISN
jgi:hypothetical protein